MSDKIGYIIKTIRIKNNKTQYEVAKSCFCSRENISKVERGLHNPSTDLLYSLSICLKFDFITLNKKLSNFKNYNHYYLTHELINYIDDWNISKIEQLLKSPIINEFDYGEPLIVKRYCVSLILIHVKKDYSTLLDLCLETLDITYEKITEFVPKVDEHNYYYGFIISLSSILNHNKNFIKLLLFQENIIKFLENNYFNDIVATSSIDLYLKKFYITILNNYADTLFNLEKYSDSLNICNKTLNISNELNITNIIPYVLKLKIMNLYKLNNISEAKIHMDYIKSICIIFKCEKYYDDTIAIFEKELPLIFS